MTSEFDDYEEADDPSWDVLNRDRWAGLVMTRGLLPVVPFRDVLPDPSHDYDGCLVLIPGEPSTLYFGAVDGSGDPEWVQVAAGTP